MPDSIAAVVVSYNRKHLLVECVDALLAQTVPLEAIYVIDNASTDGTQELLRERGYLRLPTIRSVVLPQNSGGAGGFHDGMEIAYADGHDWIWVMDDDCEPLPDALALMLPCTTIPQVAAIANRKLRADRGELSVGNTLPMPGKPGNEAGYKYLSFSSFVGLMVHRSTIERIGLPRKEFFIYGDDVEYCQRIITVGNIAYADTSIVLHKEHLKEPIVRCSIFGRTARRLTFKRSCMEYFTIRNILWTDRHSPGSSRLDAVHIVLICLKRIVRVLIVDRDHRLLRIWVLLRAYRDGFFGHFDNSFPFRILAKHPPSTT